ncbi:MAG: histidine--tRNA ligase [Bacteroidales bacterium]|nr:histidine--tRNA ligase [Bacteroidales bacterium]
MEYKAVKGTRDFLPLQMQKRNYIFSTITSVYKSHGFLQIETPAMENLSTLMGKYGDEGDKLLFKILDSGIFLRQEKFSSFEDEITSNHINKAASMICEKGLRYDLTVPFARFVVNHQNDIVFPFKRYQIQPVWRADKPQKGRYREFYQCDADIIGSDSLMNEVELIEIISEVFSKLKLNVTIKLNNRKILAAIASVIGHEDKITEITVAIDKLDKIGVEGVEKELLDDGFTEQDVEKLRPILLINGTNEEKIKTLSDFISSNEQGKRGIEELEFVLNKCKAINIENIEFDITLARGLNYYTGAIVEVKANDVAMGSITGGGRYDNLTGIFGLKDVSGVGISFGADRIYDCLEELNLFPDEVKTATDVLFINFGEKESEKCLLLAKQLRSANISCEVYPDSAKMQKQMKYANNRNIPFVCLLGENEIANGTIVIKNMLTGEQQTTLQTEILQYFRC